MKSKDYYIIKIKYYEDSYIKTNGYSKSDIITHHNRGKEFSYFKLNLGSFCFPEKPKNYWIEKYFISFVDCMIEEIEDELGIIFNLNNIIIF